MYVVLYTEWKLCNFMAIKSFHWHCHCHCHFRFKWFTSFYDNSSAFSNLTGNTFYMFKPIQFIVYYNYYYYYLLLGLIIRKFVLSILRDNRLAFNHFIMLPSSLLMTMDNSCKFFDLQNNAVSMSQMNAVFIVHCRHYTKILIKSPGGDSGISRDLMIRRLNQYWIGAQITILNGPLLLTCITFNPRMDN